MLRYYDDNYVYDIVIHYDEETIIGIYTLIYHNNNNDVDLACSTVESYSSYSILHVY